MKRGMVCGAAVIVLLSAASGVPAFAAKKKLVVWALLEPQFMEMAKRYTKAHPNVDVSIQTGTQDKFYTMIIAGLMPDVWGPWNTPGLKADVNRNWVTELDPYIARDGKAMDIDDFFPGIMRQFRVYGKQYSLPVFSYTDYFFYNTTLWDNAGLARPTLDASDRSWNWDKWVECALKMTKRDASGKLTVAGAEFTTYVGANPNHFSLWGVSQYGQDALKTAVPQKLFWDNPEMVRCLTKLWELMYKHKVAYTGQAAGKFIDGKVGSSIFASPYINGYMGAKNLKWAIAPLPWAVTNSGTLWPDGWRIGKVGKNKELAWDFIKFMCEPANMAYTITDPKSGRKGTPAARKSVFRETLGRDIGRVTGMSPDDVFKVQAQMDDAGIVKVQDTICLHTDIYPSQEPVFIDLWLNKLSPAQAAAKLQSISDKTIPVLFSRWLRNVKFTGADKAQQITAR